MGVQGLVPLTHWHSCALNGCSGCVQYSLIGVHAHSQAFRGCSILTHWRSCVLTSVQGVFSSDTNEIFLMVTSQWVAFNNDSMAVVLNDLKQKQLRDETKEARSECVPNPFQITDLELDIWIFRPKKQFRERYLSDFLYILWKIIKLYLTVRLSGTKLWS